METQQAAAFVISAVEEESSLEEEEVKGEQRMRGRRRGDVEGRKQDKQRNSCRFAGKI